MNTSALPKPIKAELEAVFRNYPDANCIGIYQPHSADNGSDTITANIENMSVRVVSCVSELAMREQLLLQAEHDDRLVLLSAIDTNLLAEDVLNQLWRRKLRHIDPWRTVIERLGLRTVDHRLVSGNKHRWFAEAMLEVWPDIEDQVNLGQVLDFNNAWLTLSRGVLGFEAAQLDIDTLFNWGLDPTVTATALPAEFMEGVQPWFEQRLHKHSTLVSNIIFASDGDLKKHMLLPLGLVAHVLSEYAPENDASARVRLEERYLQGNHSDTTLGAFGKAAHRFASRVILQNNSASLSMPIKAALDQADEILADLGCSGLAIHSDILPSGHELQLERIAEFIHSHSKADIAQLNRLEEWKDELQQHKLLNTARYEGVQKAVALMRWLATDVKKDMINGAPALMLEYQRDGGFVDFARSVLWSGDNNQTLSEAYQVILQQVSERVESGNKLFSTDINTIARGDKLPEELVYVEDAIDHLVAPVAKQHPVLLLVMDGMSQAVWREFSSDLVSDNWEEYRRRSGDDDSDTIGCSLVAALPTVTKVCRQALLTGKLAQGDAADEEKGFSTHPALTAQTTKAAPPVLFHKGKLSQSATPGLAPDVRSVIADDSHRIVAIVINAVDDQLSSNDQLNTRWKLHSLPVVEQILETVRESGRVLILTSDHGHVRSYDSERGERGVEVMDGRYKPGDSTVNEGEIAISGARVVTEDSAVVLPWSEKIRYANPKKGFHGGASLQEVVIPFGVYASPLQGLELEGWHRVPQEVPSWWFSESRISNLIVQEPVAAIATATRPEPEKGTTPDLFAPPVTEEVVTGEATGTESWIDRLLNSAVLASQRKRNPRPMISDQVITALLECLEQRGSQAGLVEIAQATGKPRVRVSGFVAAVRKLLNVDGFDILSEDKNSRTVRLNLQHLQTQFLLDE